MSSPARAIILACAVVSGAGALRAGETKRLYLSGRGPADAVDWDFLCTGGRKSGKWTTIPVPSNWEFHGFGAYNYGHHRRKSDEKGRYRRRFKVPASWTGGRVRIVFEGVMTDAEVRVNDRTAGEVHRGGFYRFRYDITDLVKFGDENLLEATVSKVSSDRSVEAAERRADYWVFGGIYRPVYLERLPGECIDRTAIDARADGSFSVDVHPAHVGTADNLTARIVDADGTALGRAFGSQVARGADKVTLRTKVTGHKTWTAESPDLYKVEVALRKGRTEVHSVTERFGFRTVEVRAGKGVFLNGQKIRLKGVNRHCFWPDSGRCLGRKHSFGDARLIKQMNMNAVRMSHYPPDVHFLEACDELGLYVLDELAGWQRPSYSTEAGRKLLREMVARDVNHPCILFWDNANEGGWNAALDGHFAKHDPQKRTVLHPWAKFGGIDTDHYETYDSTRRKLGGSTIFMTTEFLHGLYDGGHGAGLDDYWKAMRASPLGAGGFLWVFSDEGAVRTDQGGRIDVDGNHAPDGIVGPYREKEGSFYTIKEIWSPVQVDLERLPADFDGTIPVRNEYDFTDLGECRFEWKLVDFPDPGGDRAGHEVNSSGRIAGPKAPPGSKARIRIPLPGDWRKRDALYLTAFGRAGAELWTWSWPVKTPADHSKALVGTAVGRSASRVTSKEAGNVVTVRAGDLEARFDRATGRLLGASRGGRSFPLANGPRLVPGGGGEGAGGGGAAGFTGTEAGIASAKASTHERPNSPERSFDGSASTRWSANGKGQWIRYELRRATQIDTVAVAWDRGHQRRYAFVIELSGDGERWSEVHRGRSSGKTDRLESYSFKAATARYVRITGRGNSANDWVNVSEVKIGSSAPAKAAPARTKPEPTVTREALGKDGVLAVEGVGGFERITWKPHAGGWLELRYRYRLSGEHDFFGVTFDCPEKEIAGAKWLGRGPYRVWKNRMKGTRLDVWQRNHNDSTPGELWQYPEFKGYFAGMRWAVLRTRGGPITVATDTEDLFLRIFTPKFGRGARGAAAAFPPGDISFLHAIAPIGTKFHRADRLGPQSRKTRAEGTYEGVLYFRFGGGGR